MTLMVFAASLGLLSSPPSLLHATPAARSVAEPPPAASVVGRRTVARFLLLAASSGLALPARAADERRWVSGRSDPIRKTSKDKPDGTKKDPNFYKCLNDCVPRCLGPPGSVMKERTDCLLECQDECCTTYEQCTATIRF